MPVFEAGVAEGTMSAGHVDVAAAAHAKLSDEVAREFAGHADNLVRRSQQLGVDDFDRECRDLARHLTSMHDRNAEIDDLERQQAASSVKRWVDRGTGMCNTLISLDPLRDAKMWKVINHQVAHERQQRTSEGQQPLSFTALQAQAVVTAVTSGSGVLDGSGSGLDACSTSSASQRLPEISILCDLDTLITGIRATAALCETDDGVALPPDTVRRLACDAHIVPIVLGSTGEVLDQGSTSPHRHTGAAKHARSHAPALRLPRLHHRVLRLQDPPRSMVVGTQRPDRH